MQHAAELNRIPVQVKFPAAEISEIFRSLARL